MSKPIRQAQILLVEDNPAEAELIQRIFKREKINNTIHHVECGDDALAFLMKKGDYSDSPTVDLVLLDLNLPDMSGIDVLVEIRADPRLATLPIVMLTNSHNPEDIDEAYRQHVNCYVTKPVSIDGLAKVVQSIDDFWFGIAVRPKD